MHRVLSICLLGLSLGVIQAAETYLPIAGDALAFGVDDGDQLRTILPVAASERILLQDDRYMALLNPELNGIRMSRPSWGQEPPSPQGGASTGGTVKGTVRYQANPAKPWRLSRYYIKNSKRGWLAECAVALTGPNLSSVAPPAAPSTVTIDQRNFMFVPETVAIRAGDSVKFTNSDDSLHNVMTNDGKSPFNISMAKGDEYTHLFATAGGLAKPVRLGCVFHGGMRGWIYVFVHPFFQTTGSDGQFEFSQVPPGKYTLKVLHPAGRLTSERLITLLPGQTASLDIVVSSK